MVSNESGYYRENAFIIEKRKRLAQEEMQTKNATSSQKPPLSVAMFLLPKPFEAFLVLRQLEGGGLLTLDGSQSSK
ncbi:hypothetical protein [Cytobacillus pseudoceanisediminis]|jgi:hypothetical protein|uniref:hypothetical protein n=1 Tax=Cytobacillus pseudoceanisediminis TaxID=3051614 RepID=UPI0002E59029